jgi:hypothetical protein
VINKSLFDLHKKTIGQVPPIDNLLQSTSEVVKSSPLDAKVPEEKAPACLLEGPIRESINESTEIMNQTPCS